MNKFVVTACFLSLVGCSLVNQRDISVCATTPTATTADLRSDATNFAECEIEQLNEDSLDLAGRNLESIRLSGSVATNTNFAGANLSQAQLSNSVLNSSNFSEADLTNASLALSSFIDADFRAADLTNANFSGANLRGAQFAGATLENTYTSPETTCPDGSMGPCNLGG